MSGLYLKYVNPSNAEATFVQNKRGAKISENRLILVILVLVLVDNLANTKYAENL